MACCESCGSASCTCDPTVLDGAAINRTLAASLVGTVDCIRDLYTCFGTRPYQVMLVWTQWSGGERGVGRESVLREERLLPTPKVADISSLSRELQPIGSDEAGSVRVSEISARYTEDYLLGRDSTGAEIPKDQNFYWELRFPQADGRGARRRFSPKSAPTLDAMNFQWKLSLQKVSEDRTRAGNVRG